jgi:hypothetical protein
MTRGQWDLSWTLIGVQFAAPGSWVDIRSGPAVFTAEPVAQHEG